MRASVAGSIAVVTGASGGIGRATAIEFGRRGATVALIARGRAGVDGAVRDVEATGATALGYRGIPLQSAYCASKHAIQGFNESLRCELLHDGSEIRTTMVVMPAVNTPQFSWLLSRLPKHARPVPPIYQPEVAARAVVYAAEHPGRREYWVGFSTVKTLLGNMVAAGLLDRYRARTGYSAQQTSEGRDPTQPANLWHPADADRDYGTHGVFDDKSRRSSAQVWASQHHGLLSALGAAAIAAAGAVAALRRSPVAGP